jgi:large subunit ribosomal protein L10
MANQMIIDLKQEQVKEIAEKMSKAKSVVVAEYRGLTVEKTQELRRKLRGEGCEMLVLKNNISRRAALNIGYDGITSDLTGPNGVIFSFEDSVSAAKILAEFAKKNPKLIIKSGIIDGDFYEPAKIKEIAALPNRETLLTMLASQLLGPLRELSIGLDLLTKMDSEQKEESN